MRKKAHLMGTGGYSLFPSAAREYLVRLPAEPYSRPNVDETERASRGHSDR
jgi:hypothetical protein